MASLSRRQERGSPQGVPFRRYPSFTYRGPIQRLPLDVPSWEPFQGPLQEVPCRRSNPGAALRGTIQGVLFRGPPPGGLHRVSSRGPLQSLFRGPPRSPLQGVPTVLPARGFPHCFPPGGPLPGDPIQMVLSMGWNLWGPPRGPRWVPIWGSSPGGPFKDFPSRRSRPECPVQGIVPGGPHQGVHYRGSNPRCPLQGLSPRVFTPGVPNQGVPLRGCSRRSSSGCPLRGPLHVLHSVGCPTGALKLVSSRIPSGVSHPGVPTTG
jgi:hypothetical protein